MYQHRKRLYSMAFGDDLVAINSESLFWTRKLQLLPCCVRGNIMEFLNAFDLLGPYFFTKVCFQDNPTDKRLLSPKATVHWGYARKEWFTGRREFITILPPLRCSEKHQELLHSAKVAHCNQILVQCHLILCYFDSDDLLLVHQWLEMAKLSQNIRITIFNNSYMDSGILTKIQNVPVPIFLQEGEEYDRNDDTTYARSELDASED